MAGRVRLVMIGDELLDGRTYESNSHWLIQRLSGEGFVVAGAEIVGDGVPEIAAALARAGEDGDAVLASGGLGPTIDDRSREALALYLDEELVEDVSVVELIRERFESRGRTMPEANIRQAQRPASAEMLPNPIGTAPGLWCARGDVAIGLVPGVPAEMRRMFDEQILPRLGGLAIERRRPELRLRVSRAGESQLAEWVEAALEAEGLEGIDRAYCVQRDGLDVLLRAAGEGDDQTARLVRAADAVEQALTPRVYARGDGDLAALLLARLEASGQTLGVAESCTAGMLGSRLADTPGSSRVFVGGVIAYSDDLKESLLGVSASTLDADGAVSEATAHAMASGLRERLGCDHALSLTGIAGPGGGTAEKPVGTIWIAHADGEGVRTRLLRLPGDRQQNRQWSVAAALDLLREGTGDGRLDL